MLSDSIFIHFNRFFCFGIYSKVPFSPPLFNSDISTYFFVNAACDCKAVLFFMDVLRLTRLHSTPSNELHLDNNTNMCAFAYLLAVVCCRGNLFVSACVRNELISFVSFIVASTMLLCKQFIRCVVVRPNCLVDVCCLANKHRPTMYKFVLNAWLIFAHTTKQHFCVSFNTLCS